jgi:hypothetical protein
MNRSKVGLTITLGAVAIAALLMVLAATSGSSQAQGGGKTAVMVVEFSDGTSSTRAIAWTDPISRVAGLELAGFEVAHQGDVVCSIDGDGCPVDDCWGCGENNWWQGRWLGGVWDGSEWPPPNIGDDDTIGFHNSDAWAPPEVTAPAYVAVAKGLEYLRPLQSSDDGSYPSLFGKVDATTGAALDIAANSQDPAEWRRTAGSPSLMDYIQGPDGTEYADSGVHRAGKLGVTLAAAQDAGDPGVCWPAFAKEIMGYYVPIAGTFYTDTVEQAGLQSWAVLGLAAIGETVPADATQALIDMANPDGGWGWSDVFGGSDSMVTAQSIQALVAAGVPADALCIQNGLAYLEASQNDNGGFAYQAPGASDVDSTSYAIQAIVAAGEDPLTGTWQTISGTMPMTPITYLLSVQLPDGSFPAYSSMLATQNALPALLQRPLPLAVTELGVCPTWSAYVPAVMRNGR